MCQKENKTYENIQIELMLLEQNLEDGNVGKN